MDLLKFLKKHYEKVVLSLLLAALATATIFLLLRVSTERGQLNEKRNMDVRSQTKALQVLNLETNESLLLRLRRPAGVQLDGEHNLFNPVTWKQRQDNNLIKVVTGNEIGAGALVITDLKPLMLLVSYEGSQELVSETSYKFKVTQEAHRDPRKRSPMTRQVSSAGQQNDLFILREMRPSAADPQEFLLEMVDEKEEIVVGKDQPYEGVAGYTVDLRYPPDNQVFLNKRVSDKLVFGGDTNVIVSVEASNVTVEALSNRKRTTIERSEMVVDPLDP